MDKTTPGSAIALGATIAPLFTQLGIYDELLQLATRLTHVHVISENMKPVYTMDLRHIKDMYVRSPVPQLPFTITETCLTACRNFTS